MTETDVASVDLLLVEDDHDDARFVERLIHERQSIRRTDGGTPLIEVTGVDHVDRLADALARVRSEDPPDAVLLDLMLPDSRGLSTVERLAESAPTVPIVVLTGRDDASVGIEAIRHGAQDYLSKDGISGEGVLRALRYAVERTRTRRELSDRNHRLAVIHRIVRRDIRNDLSVVIGLGDGLRETVEPADAETVEMLLEAARHATDLTDTAADVIDVISTDDVRLSQRDLGMALDAAITRTHDETTATITVEHSGTDDAVTGDDGVTDDAASEPITVWASPMLESAFVHLLSDATERADRSKPHVTVVVDATPDVAVVTFSGDVDPVVDDRRSRETSPASNDRRLRTMRVGSYLATTLFESFGGEVRTDAADGEPRLMVELPRAPRPRVEE